MINYKLDLNNSLHVLTVFRGEKGDPGITGDEVGNLVDQPSHGFSSGTVLRFNGTGFVPAINDSLENLGRYMVKQVLSPDRYTLARSGDVISTGLILKPGAWYHTSPTTLGALVEVTGDDLKPPSGAFANPMGQAISTSSLIYLSYVPYSV